MHKKSGYILFLLFGILTLCMTIITLFMARSNSYQQLMLLLTRKNITTNLALSCTALGESLLYVEKKNEENSQSAKNTQTDSSSSDSQNSFQQILNHIYTPREYILKEQTDGIDATINLYLMSEDGKININSFYNFSEKKFIKEGQAGDRKKFCEWMFKKISMTTGKPSLFEAFEKHLKTRDNEFNDVTELLQIKEFEQTFEDKVFYTVQSSTTKDSEQKNIYLTDLFTVITEQDSLNPWFLSDSWKILLNIDSKQNLTPEQMKKIVTTFKKEANWDKDWDKSISLFYQKEYKDIPTEIKSVLTTDCEANIFSLLLSATIGETTSTIFTILKKQSTGNTATFDMVKVYQI